MTFGEKSVADITTGDIRGVPDHHRRTQKRSAVTINHDPQAAAKECSRGAIRERMLTATPFKCGG